MAIVPVRMLVAVTWAVWAVLSFSLNLNLTGTGPYKVAQKSFSYQGMDSTNKQIDVTYPVSEDGSKTFPVIAYAHGFTDTGFSTYAPLMADLASWGYVVATHLACRYGCTEDCKSLLLDPLCFGNYYKQQLAVVTWSRTADVVAELRINTAIGAGAAGHSMGGQSTIFSSAYEGPNLDIKAAVLHFSYTHTYPAIQIPFLAFTGTKDTTAAPAMSRQIFDHEQADPVRGFANRIGATHQEPAKNYNPLLTLYTAAWFKLHLEGVTEEAGTDFEELIYGTGASSLCHGGYGDMQACDLVGYNRSNKTSAV